MTIMHISTDFPDQTNAAKTPAIQNLVTATSNVHDHFVYSLNRIDVSAVAPLSNIFKAAGKGVNIQHESTADNIANWSYEAPSKSIFLKRAMRAIGEQIAEDVNRRGTKPDLIQGHKLSMEGIAAHHAAQLLNVPFAISVQGNSDRSIAQIRRDLWPLYRRIFHEAAIVFPFSPWALQYLESKFGKRVGKTQLLPCITHQDKLITPKKTGNRIISAFHLKNWRLKNLPALVGAANFVADKIDGFHLDILGGGDAEEVAEANACIRGSDGAKISLFGRVEADNIQAEMNASAGFAMLSHKESFGMVFIEALLAGCPVVYPADAAIDGYFDEYDFAIPAPAGDQRAISEAMLKLLKDQDSLKANLNRWQESGAAKFFQQEQIARSYAEGLTDAIKGAGNA